MRKFLKILLITCFFTCFSVCFASLTYHDIEDLNSIACDKYIENNGNQASAGNIGNFNSFFNSTCWNTEKYGLNFENYNNFMTRWQNATYFRQLDIFVFNDDNNYINVEDSGLQNSNGYYIGYIRPGTNISCTCYTFKTTSYNDISDWEYVSTTSVNWTTQRNLKNTTDKCTLFFNGLINIEEPVLLYGYNIIPVQLNFVLNDNTKINVYSGDSYKLFNRLQFTYNTTSKLLGYIENYDNIYSLQGYFGPYVSFDVVDNTLAQFYWNKDFGSKNGSIGFNDSTGRLTINTSKLINNQGYNLVLMYQNEKNGQWFDLGSYNFYAMYYNNNSISGDLISSDLNNSTDIGFVNALDDYFGTFSGDFDSSEYLIKSLFGSVSGDLLSGDFISGDFFGIHFVDYDDFGFGDFIYSIYINIYKILNNYDDVIINFGFLGDISSSIFILPSGPLKTFVGIFSSSLFLIFIIMFYYRLIKAISTFDLSVLLRFDMDELFGLF